MEIISHVAQLLGIEKYEIRKDELHCLCLNPNHDDRTLGNFSINLENGRFYCFACGFAGNLIGLLFNKGNSYTESIALWHYIRLESKDELLLPSPGLDRYIVEPYLKYPPSQYAIDRIGDISVLEEYDVHSDENGNPIFLSRNVRGRFTSVWVREKGQYFLIEPLNAKRIGIFYGEHLPPSEYTILCEGPFDAIAARKWTGQKAICGFGTQLSKWQIQRLKHMNNVVIFFDGDNAGRNARDKLSKILSGKGDLFLMGGYIGDPDELGSKIPQIFERKKINSIYGLERIKNEKQ